MSSLRGMMDERLLFSPTVASKKPMGVIDPVIPVAFIKWSYPELQMNQWRWEEIVHERIKFHYLQTLPHLLHKFKQELISIYQIGEIIAECKRKGESRFKLDYSKEDNKVLTKEDERVLEGLTLVHRIHQPPRNWSLKSPDRYRDQLERREEENSEHLDALRDMQDIFHNFQDIAKTPADLLSNLVYLSWDVANRAESKDVVPISKRKSEVPTWFQVLNNLKKDPDRVVELLHPHDPGFSDRFQMFFRAGSHQFGKIIFLQQRDAQEINHIKKSSPGSYLSSLSQMGMYRVPLEGPLYEPDISSENFYSCLANIDSFDHLPVILPDQVLLNPEAFLQGKRGSIFQYKEGSLVGKEESFTPLLLELLFAHSIIEWVEGNKNLICPLLKVRRNIRAFEKGCPLDEEGHVPGASNRYCVDENEVNLNEAKMRNCLFWDVFNRIFEGFDSVEGGNQGG